MEYKIDGLTKKQAALLDIMWTLDSEDSVQNFIRSLPRADRVQAQSLMIILVHEMLEEFLQDALEFPDARTVIDHVRSL
jgi:hypothetical protein